MRKPRAPTVLRSEQTEDEAWHKFDFTKKMQVHVTNQTVTDEDVPPQHELDEHTLAVLRQLTSAQLRTFTTMATKATVIAKVQTLHGGIVDPTQTAVAAIQQATAGVSWRQVHEEGSSTNASEARPQQFTIVLPCARACSWPTRKTST